MKAISIARRFASVLALLLAIMMLFAACGPDETESKAGDPADQTETSSEVVNDASDEANAENENQQTDNTSKQNQQTNNTSKQNQQTTTAGKQDAFNNANDATFLKSAPKGEIHILMWRKFHKSEQFLVDQYKKQTGNNVKVTIVPEVEYTSKLVTMVTGKKDVPDVVVFSSNIFPGLATRALQPLKNKDFQLDSDCWNKAYMDAYKINGVYFGVAQPTSWSCEDCTYVTYYSPAVLKNFNYTGPTPYQLYKDGKWNWETQAEIARAVAQKGGVGMSVQGYDLFMLSAGADFVKYDGSKYENMLGSVKGASLLTKAWTEVAELMQDDVITSWDITNVQQGRVGLFTAISYGLYNEGDWFQKSFAAKLEAVPVAGPKGGTAYTPVRPKCWGVPKGAKNPEGAAYFLRYFLDTSALKFDTTFHNKQFGEVYKTITKSSAKKTVMHGSGVSDYVKADNYRQICDALARTSPNGITTTLNSKKTTIQPGITKANKDLSKIKK